MSILHNKQPVLIGSASCCSLPVLCTVKSWQGSCERQITKHRTLFCCIATAFPGTRVGQKVGHTPAVQRALCRLHSGAHCVSQQSPDRVQQLSKACRELSVVSSLIGMERVRPAQQRQRLSREADFKRFAALYRQVCMQLALGRSSMSTACTYAMCERALKSEMGRLQHGPDPGRTLHNRTSF